MNKEQAFKLLPILQAIADGKTVQRYDKPSGKWFDHGDKFYIEHDHDYRIKPEPKYREWRHPSEVPLGAIVSVEPNRYLITGAAFDNGNLIVTFGKNYWETATKMLHNYKLEGCKICGVLES